MNVCGALMWLAVRQCMSLSRDLVVCLLGGMYGPVCDSMFFFNVVLASIPMTVGIV